LRLREAASGRFVFLWTLAAGTPERAVLWTQVQTGLELNADRLISVLSAAEWHERRRRLEDLDGPPGQ